MTDLGFTIEQRAGTNVLVYDDGSCHPATPDVSALWQALEVERHAFAGYRVAAEQAAREDATRALVLQEAVDAQRGRAEEAEAERDRAIEQVDEWIAEHDREYDRAMRLKEEAEHLRTENVRVRNQAARIWHHGRAERARLQAAVDVVGEYVEQLTTRAGLASASPLAEVTETARVVSDIADHIRAALDEHLGGDADD